MKILYQNISLVNCEVEHKITLRLIVIKEIIL